MMQRRDAPMGDVGTLSAEDLEEVLSAASEEAIAELPPGRFIVLEGIDGTGKSHVAGRVVEHLEGREVSAKATSEPTKGLVGKLLRGVVEEGLDPYTELFLFLADRADHTQWIEARLREGCWVVCDRYAMSSAAYQGTYLEEEWEAKGRDPVSWIMELHRGWWREPDITFLIVDDVERCLERASGRGPLTKFERVGYLTRVQENYLRMKGLVERVVVIDTPDLEDIIEAVLGRVEAILGNSDL